MAQEVRSSQTGAAQFDFSSQAGVMKILQAVRQSSISQAEKSDLRDLVFSYANGGGDPAVRNILESRLVAAGIVTAPTVPANTPPAEAGPGFAGSRPAPTFGTSTQPNAPASAAGVASAPVPPTSTPVTPTPPPPMPQTSGAQAASYPPPPPPTAPASPISPTLPSQPAPVATVTPTVPTPSQPLAAAPSAPVAAPTPPVAPPPVPAGTQSVAALDRIRQIKSEVNSRFGNPVNIVDINNAVGREYMSALLEAMKQVSSDSPIMINDVMERLEAAYTAVRALASTNTPPAPAVAQPAPVAQSATNATELPVIPPTTPITPVTPVAPIPTSQVPSESQMAAPAPAPVSEMAVSHDEERWRSDTPIMPDATTVPIRKVNVGVPGVAIPTPQPIGDLPTRLNETPPVPVSPPQPDSMQPPVPEPAPTPQSSTTTPSQASPLPSVAAAAEPLKTPNVLPDASSLATASIDGNPLYTKEVDAGLEQLLLEWPIFKKSGLFGTGPRGSQHPLFKKIAPLQIPLVLAGRFEGSTQEIKQSVTDYMNGWRYEQGIIYEKGETFEQYLRRVIRHIIDWQKKKVGS